MYLTNCVKCGAAIQFNYGPPFGAIIKTHNYCFNCAYWYCHLKLKNKPNKFIIDGVLYTDAGNSKKKTSTLGFGGQHFKIIKNGITINTNNLWCNGKIPDHWKTMDNAKFINIKTQT